MDRKETILIVRLGAIGDVIHTLPALSALRNHFPDAFISWVVGEKSAPILKGHPFLDRLFILKDVKMGTGKPDRSGVGVVNIIKALRQIPFTTALDFQGLIKSGFWTRMSGAGLRIGFSRSACRESLNVLFTNKKIKPPDRVHVIRKNMSLLQGLGVPSSRIHFQFPKNKTAEEYVASYLKKLELENYIVINPSAAWRTKRWPAEKFAGLVERIHAELEHACLILWGPGERAIAEDVCQRSRKHGILSFPTSLMELLVLIRGARLYIGGDTASLHMATAQGVPVVGIYGPTTPWRNGPLDDADLVAFRELECSHCYKRDCREMACFKAIQVEDVFRLVEQRLKTSRPQAVARPL